jgi:hypothetical protein
MSSFRSFDGGSVLKCSAQIASNWAMPEPLRGREIPVAMLKTLFLI